MLCPFSIYGDQFSLVNADGLISEHRDGALVGCHHVDDLCSHTRCGHMKRLADHEGTDISWFRSQKFDVPRGAVPLHSRGGRGEWVLLQFDSSSVHQIPTRRLELWAVPAKNPRLSQGVALGLHDGVVSLGISTERGDWLLWCALSEDGHAAKFSGVSCMSVERLVCHLEALVEIRNEEVKMPLHDFSFWKDHAIPIIWKLPPLKGANSAIRRAQIRQSVGGAKWRNAVYFCSTDVSRPFTLDVAEESDEERPIICALPPPPDICLDLLGRLPMASILVRDARGHVTRRSSRVLGGRTTESSLLQGAVGEIRAADNRKDMNVNFNVNLDTFVVSHILDVELSSQSALERSLIFFIGAPLRMDEESTEISPSKRLFAVDVNSHQVAELLFWGSFYHPSSVVETNEGLFFSWKQETKYCSADSINLLPFEDHLQWVDAATRRDIAYNAFHPENSDAYEELNPHAYEEGARECTLWRRRPQWCPMEFEVIAGVGCVPDEVRAANYRALDDGDEEGGLGMYLGGVMWSSWREHPKWVVECTIVDWVRGRRSSGSIVVVSDGLGVHEIEVSGERAPAWIGVVDWRKCPETRSRMAAASAGLECKFMSCSDGMETLFRPPVDSTAQSAYFAVTSGDLVVANTDRGGDGNGGMVVGNVKLGKWFWRLHPAVKAIGVPPQFVVWHESVESDQRLTHIRGRERERDYVSEKQVPIEEIRSRWRKAEKEANLLLGRPGMEALLARQLRRYMATDPDSAYWKREELPDGFLRHKERVAVAQGKVGVFDAATLEDPLGTLPQSFFFANRRFEDWRSSRVVWGSSFGMPGGCGCNSGGRSADLSVDFKKECLTGKIVVARVVYSD